MALGSILVGGLLTLAVAAPASATTFCVPGYHAACPDNGINEPQVDLETAMKANATDGIPDRAIIAPGTLTDPNAFETAGTDDLEVIGAGPNQTRLTTSTTGITWVVNLDFASAREVTMRDLTIVMPATAGDNSAAVHSNGDKLINVDIETHKAGVQGVAPAEGGTVFRDGDLFAVGAGSFIYGFWVSPTADEAGQLTIERTRISNTSRGVYVEEPNLPLVLRGVQIKDPGEFAVGATSSNDVTIENSVIENGSFAPVYLLSNTAQKQTVDLTNVTMDSSTGDAAEPAILGTVQNAVGNGSIDIEVNNSIIRGFDSTWQLSSPAGNPLIGDAYISLRYSNFLPAGSNAGSGTTYLAPNNTEGDPQFTGPGDYRLKPGSPAIDRGDPAAGGLPDDLLGQPRPMDGNDDGVAVTDQGAYEYQPPDEPQPVCETNPTLCPQPPPPDTTAPTVSKVKFLTPTRKRGGYLKFTLSEAASVKASFKPTPPGKGRKKRRTVKLSKQGKAGVNKIAIKKGKMKPGKYRLTMVATDQAGNRSGTLRGRVKVSR